RLNQKGVYSNVISFCARVLALCFFKIPGVGFALLHALPVNRFHIKRILREAVGDDNL
ncbi:12458_t:CDS:2, partial [Acaulospora morrowiae]